jgi:uncharacterized protein YeeX (DUF496 family)
MRIDQVITEFEKIQEILKKTSLPEEMGYFSKILKTGEFFTHYLIIFYTRDKFVVKDVLKSDDFAQLLIENTKIKEFIKPADNSFTRILDFLFWNYTDYLTAKSAILQDFSIKQKELGKKLWKDQNNFYYFANPFEPNIIFHLFNQKESFVAFIQLKDLYQQGQDNSKTMNTTLLKDQLFALLEEKNSLLSNNTEKQMEIEMLKTQLELSFNSYEEQIADFKEKIRELERENRILREKLSEFEANEDKKNEI